jgi:RNA polymerase sigma-70 factor, ECF subfamily
MPERPGEDLTAEEEARLAAAFEEHRPRLLAWLEFRIPAPLRRRLDPDDVLQEAFTRARQKYRAWRTRPDTSEYVFLFWAVRDVYLRKWEEHTRGRRDLRKELPWPEESSAQVAVGLLTVSTPSDDAARQDLRERVRRVMEQLSPADLEVLALRYFRAAEPLAFRDVAAVLGIAEEAARQRHARALARFGKLWQRFGPPRGEDP